MNARQKWRGALPLTFVPSMMTTDMSMMKNMEAP